MIAAALARTVDSFVAADPGLTRLKNALRVMLSCLFTGFLEVAWTVAHGLPPTVAAPGLLFAMIAPLFVRDTRRQAWFASLAWLYALACATFALAVVAGRVPLVGDALFLLVLFAGMLCQACGPRALGGALLALVMFYLGLYLHPTTQQAVAAFALSLLAPATVALVGRVLVPPRPGLALRMAARTVLLRAARVLDAGAGPCAKPGVPGQEGVARLSALNEAALALEAQLAQWDVRNAGVLREALVELEVAAGRHVLGAPDAHLDRAVARFARHARGAERALEHGAGGAGAPGMSFAALTWLPALRMTTAALLAMLLGHSLSPERWFWAVITTFVVFLGTHSRADTIYRGTQRLIGTLAGSAAGALLIGVLHGSLAWSVVAMLVCVFGWAYCILNVYSAGVFFITMLVGLVYGQLGFAIGPLMEVRLEEVLLGCALSFAVAIVLMPLAATQHIERRLAALLVALRGAVQAAQHGDASALTAAVRAVDRRWQELGVALRPLQTRPLLAHNAGIEHGAALLLCCVHWTRALVREHGADAARAPWRYAAIVARLDALIASRREQAGEGGAAGPAIERRASPSASGHDSPARTAHDAAGADALAQLDGALALFERHLARPGRTLRPRLQLAFR